MSSGETGTPVEIVRPQRILRVIYQDDAQGWHASSPDVRRLKESAPTLAEVQAKTRARLQVWLHSRVAVQEIVHQRPVDVSLAMPGVVRIDRHRSFVPGAAHGTRATVRARVDVDSSRLAVGA